MVVRQIERADPAPSRVVVSGTGRGRSEIAGAISVGLEPGTGIARGPVDTARMTRATILVIPEPKNRGQGKLPYGLWW